MELPVEGVNIFNNVINDMQMIQTRYDKTLFTLNTRLRIALNDCQRYMNTIEELKHVHEKVNKDFMVCKENNNILVCKNDELISINNDLQNHIDNYTNEINEYKNIIVKIENEQKEFNKVSHVVTLEKENAKFKKEIEALKLLQKLSQDKGEDKKITILSVVEEPKCVVEEPKYVVEEPKCVVDVVGVVDVVDVVDEHDIGSEEIDDVYEKKIKGIIYYISSKDNTTIYKKNEDETIGDIIGFLEKNKSGARKVKWI